MSKIGSIYVEVKGDSSQFKKDLSALRAEAKKAGDEVSSALSSGISSQKASKGIADISTALTQLSASAKIPKKNFEETAKAIAMGMTDVAQKIGMTEKQFANLNEKMLRNQAFKQTEASLKQIANAAGLSEKEIKSLAKQMGISAKDADKMASSMKKASNGISDIGKALAASAVVWKTFDIAKNIINTGMQFEQTMATVKGVTNATAAEFNQLTAIARKMGAETEWSASQSAEALKFLGMAGFSVQDSIKALPGMLDLATAGQLDLGRAADIVTDSLTAMGMSVDELSRFNDVLVATSTRSNTTIEMMGESLKHVAPVANQLGYDIEQLSAMIGTLANAGIKGSQSGTDLRMVMLRNMEVAKQFGLEGNDLVGTLKAIKDAQWDATNIAKAYSVEAVKSILTMIDQIDSLEKFEDGLRNVTGETSRLATVFRDTLGNSFKELKSAIESVQLDIYTDSNEDIRDAVELLTTAIRDNKDMLVDFGKALIVFSSGAVVTAITVLSDFTKGLKDVGEWIGFIIAKLEGLQPDSSKLNKGILDKAISATPLGWAAGKGIKVAKSVVGMFGGEDDGKLKEEDIQRMIKLRQDELDLINKSSTTNADALELQRDRTSQLIAEIESLHKTGSPGNIHLEKIVSPVPDDIVIETKNNLNEIKTANKNFFDSVGSYFDENKELIKGANEYEIAQYEKAQKEKERILKETQKEKESYIKAEADEITKQEKETQKAIADSWKAMEKKQEDHLKAISSLQKEYQSKDDRIKDIQEYYEKEIALAQEAGIDVAKIRHEQEEAITEIIESEQKKRHEAEKKAALAGDDFFAGMKVAASEAEGSIISMGQIGADTFRTMQSAGEDMFYDLFRTGKMDFKKFTDSVVNMWLSALAQMASKKMMSSIMGGFDGSGFGGGGGGLGDIFSVGKSFFSGGSGAGISGGMDLFKQGASIFGQKMGFMAPTGGYSQFGAAANIGADAAASAGLSAPTAGQGIMGMAQGAGGMLMSGASALGAGYGVYQLAEGLGAPGGVSGALGGATAGMMIGGPIGAAIGAVAGGILGHKDRQKDWYQNYGTEVEFNPLEGISAEKMYSGMREGNKNDNTIRDAIPGILQQSFDTVNSNYNQIMSSWMQMIPEQTAKDMQDELSKSKFTLGGGGNKIRQDHEEEDIRVLSELAQSKLWETSMPAIESGLDAIFDGAKKTTEVFPQMERLVNDRLTELKDWKPLEGREGEIDLMISPEEIEELQQLLVDAVGFSNIENVLESFGANNIDDLITGIEDSALFVDLPEKLKEKIMELGDVDVSELDFEGLKNYVNELYTSLSQIEQIKAEFTQLGSQWSGIDQNSFSNMFWESLKSGSAGFSETLNKSISSGFQATLNNTIANAMYTSMVQPINQMIGQLIFSSGLTEIIKGYMEGGKSIGDVKAAVDNVKEGFKTLKPVIDELTNTMSELADSDIVTTPNSYTAPTTMNVSNMNVNANHVEMRPHEKEMGDLHSKIESSISSALMKGVMTGNFADAQKDIMSFAYNLIKEEAFGRIKGFEVLGQRAAWEIGELLLPNKNTGIKKTDEQFLMGVNPLLVGLQSDLTQPFLNYEDMFNVGTEFQWLVQYLKDLREAFGITTDSSSSASKSLKEFSLSIDKKIAELKQSELNVALPKEKFQDASARYTELYQKAMAGDAEAAKEFTSFTSTYLKSAQLEFKSSGQYQQIFSSTIDDLERLKSVVPGSSEKDKELAQSIKAIEVNEDILAELKRHHGIIEQAWSYLNLYINGTAESTWKKSEEYLKAISEFKFLTKQDIQKKSLDDVFWGDDDRGGKQRQSEVGEFLKSFGIRSTGGIVDALSAIAHIVHDSWISHEKYLTGSNTSAISKIQDYLKAISEIKYVTNSEFRNQINWIGSTILATMLKNINNNISTQILWLGQNILVTLLNHINNNITTQTESVNSKIFTQIGWLGNDILWPTMNKISAQILWLGNDILWPYLSKPSAQTTYTSTSNIDTTGLSNTITAAGWNIVKAIMYLESQMSNHAYNLNVAITKIGVARSTPSSFVTAWGMPTRPSGFSDGGIASGPTSGYPATLHGTEAIIPLGKHRLKLEITGNNNDKLIQELIKFNSIQKTTIVLDDGSELKGYIRRESDFVRSEGEKRKAGKNRMYQ